ncbi:cytochrome b5-like heme/steroid binding domain-containing protein, partial [Obelidium mucronatum]
QVFTLDEVKKHKTAKDCWMIIHGKVYDVTAFLSEHPGGEEIMVEVAGTDATEAFDDIGHSLDAKKQLAEYLVGTL